MDVLNAIKNRRSIRKYKDTDVPLDLIGAVIEAAQYAPSSGDLQSWKFVIVKEKGQKEAIAESCSEQYWVAEAPAIIVVVADEDKNSKFYGIRGEKLYSIQNCAAAIENLMLAAEELELGTCWVGAFDERRISSICSIPESARAQAIITLGFPDEIPKKKQIQPLERVIGLGRYGNPIGDTAAWRWDWSSIIEKNVKSAKKDISTVLKENLEDHRKSLGKAFDKFKKKLDERIKRPRM
ncbi:MAG: nitroreductase family protein [Candidatus Woesearchaeota archaeon]